MANHKALSQIRLNNRPLDVNNMTMNLHTLSDYIRRIDLLPLLSPFVLYFILACHALPTAATSQGYQRATVIDWLIGQTSDL